MNENDRFAGAGIWKSPTPLTRRDFLSEASLLLGSLPAIAAWTKSSAALGLVGSQNVTQASVHGKTISLKNDAIGASWEMSPTGLRLLRIENLRSTQSFAGPQPVFSLLLADGSQIASTAMRLLDAPRAEELQPNPSAARFSDRLPGRAIEATFEDVQRRVRVFWRAVLRDGSHYIRQKVTLKPIANNLSIAKIVLLDFGAPAAATAGTVKGSPVTAANWFCGFEHPLSQNAVENARASCSLTRQLPLEHGRSASYSCVIGVARDGQMRRDFLRYIERERAHSYRTFLHYNSWYDLGYFTPYNQSGALDVIAAFGEELHERRGVVLDSFLFDDGWDNHNSLWNFNSGFPQGFAPVQKAAKKYAAAPGIWLSPWGGYDGPRKRRLAYGKQHGYEENAEGFVLSGPRYFERFRSVCMHMMRAYGVNQFKFDGTGNAATVYPGSQFNSDFDAMINLIGNLRAAKPDLYVNLTTGTYPSPFWLRYADSTWRGGDDHSFAGVGTDRQQWITYRDSATYAHVVRRGPLYPLNSLMLHGLIYARYADKLNTDPAHDFPAEVHSYFGTGTQLQEMYISHDLLSLSDWDALAEAARWSRRNADILVDTHWHGGDPAQREIYGWASWSPRGGIITLRNPDNAPRQFELDPQSAFELPSGAPENYAATSPWRENASAPPITLRAGKSQVLKLRPFEVLTLQASPK
ncbi:MAG TPA: enterotoxin [Candidatus Acidoferrales bacterium]|nr:enterotoxin [Candidatus Acidoferrales bacterium]